MNKLEFLEALSDELTGLSESDIDESLNYFSEMIDDRTDDGMSEEDAVASLGTPENAAKQILMEMPLSKVVKAKVKPKGRLSALAIVLLCIGSPIWASLLIATFAVIFSVYAAIWSIVIVLYACTVALGAVGLAGVIYLPFGIAMFGKVLPSVFIFGAGLICAGLAVLAFFGSNYTAKAVIWLGKKILRLIKRCFVGKEAKA